MKIMPISGARLPPSGPVLHTRIQLAQNVYTNNSSPKTTFTNQPKPKSQENQFKFHTFHTDLEQDGDRKSVRILSAISKLAKLKLASTVSRIEP